MAPSTGMLALYRDALRRHGGAWSLLQGMVRIVRREGPGALFARRALYARRLRGEPPAGAVAPGIASPPGPAPARRPRARTRGLAPGMTLIGHPYEVLGRAEDIRTAALACDRAAIPFGLISVFGDYGIENAARHRDFPFFDRVGTTATRRANLFFLNADEIATARARLGTAVFDGPYNIGCFAWELSRFPAPWVESFAPLDEIWAPTRFIQQAIAETTGLPVVWMPFAVEPGEAGGLTRADLGLPEHGFVFLYFFDFRSYAQRKNPWAALHAFSRAFPPGGSEPVHLVVKVNGTGARPDDYRAFLDSPLARDPRVSIVDRVLDDRGIKSLVACCDCFVSLHRSEGFGRGLAEAMYYAKPVIATAYSGNLDFMNPLVACLVDHRLVPVGAGEYPFGEGQLWADADVDQAAWYMRRLVGDTTYAGDLGARAAAYIREFHSYAAVGAQYRRRLDALGLLDE